MQENIEGHGISALYQEEGGNIDKNKYYESKVLDKFRILYILNIKGAFQMVFSKCWFIYNIPFYANTHSQAK